MYNIPIIGWLIKKFQIATLESEHAEKRAEIKGRDPWNKIFTSQEIEKEKKIAEANKKKVTNLGTLIGGAYKYMKDHKILDEDVIKEFDKFCQKHGIVIQENNSVGKETLIKIAEAEKRDLQKQNQTQTVAQAPQAKAEQVQTVQAPVKEGTGMQITGASTVQNGAIINSGAMSVGKGHGQGQSAGVQV